MNRKIIGITVGTPYNPDKYSGDTSGGDGVINGLLKYTIENNQVTITGCKTDKFPEHYVIPSYIEGCPVVAIGKYAFEYTILKSIKMPRSIASIDECAFVDSDLTDIYYEGTEEEWKRILGYSELLGRVTVHYNQACATKEYVDDIVGNLESLLGGI